MKYNPFIAGNPVTGNHFAVSSRARLGNEIYSSLQVQDSIIVAPEGYGKTSIILYIEGLFHRDGRPFAYCSAQYYPFHSKLDKLILDIVGGFGIKTLSESVNFGHTVKEIDKELSRRKTSGAVAIDEGTVLFDADAPQKFDEFTGVVSGTKNIRWLLQLHPEKFNQLRLSREISHYKPYVLGPFNEEDTNELILGLSGQDLSYTPDALAEIFRLAKGHPMDTQKLGWEIFFQKFRNPYPNSPQKSVKGETNVAKADVEKAWESANQS
ncbi:hypothetical protein A3K63_00075 [Candidatus Micrarchaeota archaeon RBG_16_49_10]|nr:MAG: hypothetical protein A3K63_00075 [Candidatus Micrarchaeota archaeon RBG_16_49_10]